MAMHTKKFHLDERRRQVASLLAQSITEQEIADKLGVDRSTISRDIKVLKQMSQLFVFDLAKSNLAYYYKHCIDGIEEVSRKCWEKLCCINHFIISTLSISLHPGSKHVIQ
jgi:IS30 family transposase